MAHKGKDKGRKGDKGKGKKRDRAEIEAATGTPVVADAAPKVEAAPKVQAAPKLAPKVARRRPVVARRGTPPNREAHRIERQALPTDRPSLLALHQAARRERDAAPLLSSERAEATFEIERIEVQIARVERAMDPPLV